VLVTASYARLRTRVTDAGSGGPTFALGGALIRRPADQGAATVRYLLPRQGTLAVTGSYFGRRDDVDFSKFQRVRLGGYATLDAAADLPLGAGARAPLALTLRADNLLGRQYQAVQGYRAPGRVLLAGVRLGR
jgi:outer membrane cobalamin receptor